MYMNQLESIIEFKEEENWIKAELAAFDKISSDYLVT